ncbi:MAG: hypothetical protein LBD37_06590 [Treponema sp.]|jgi:hypothetical protein|nr:hypothetical protein [Treponema sp.]
MNFDKAALEAWCKTVGFANLGEFNMYMATGQVDSDPIGKNTRTMEMADFCDTSYGASGFDFSMTGLSWGYTLGETSLTLGSASATLFEVSFGIGSAETAVAKTELKQIDKKNWAVGFDKSGLKIHS